MSKFTTKFFNKILGESQLYTGFTLAEVLITLGIIGIVASMTIPTLYQNYSERQYLAGLKKFNSTLQQAVALWKQDIGCSSDAYTCLNQQNIVDDDPTAFDQIAKFMKITQKIDSFTTPPDWLPNQTLEYNGDVQTGTYGGVSKLSTAMVKYLMSDGTIFSVDISPAVFKIHVDVNGAKPPNRVGKDTFPFVIGGVSGKDVYYFAKAGNQGSNELGLCNIYSVCDPSNINPTIGNGACPTAYAILNDKLPDFQTLSQNVSGFKP